MHDRQAVTNGCLPDGRREVEPTHRNYPTRAGGGRLTGPTVVCAREVSSMRASLTGKGIGYAARPERAACKRRTMIGECARAPRPRRLKPSQRPSQADAPLALNRSAHLRLPSSAPFPSLNSKTMLSLVELSLVALSVAPALAQVRTPPTPPSRARSSPGR